MSKRFALLIGLNAVNPECYVDDWSGLLHYAESDVKKIKKQIIDPLEFENCQLLLGKDATRDKVLKKLADFAGEAQADDLVVVYYSGHGGQVMDQNEDEADLTDETWCLFDGQLLDDELWAAWCKFKKGVKILLLSDSCHSGTVAKNTEDESDAIAKLIAEGAKIMPFEAMQATYLKHQSFYDEISRNVPSPDTLPIEAALVSISACKDEEVAYENPKWGQGEFTHALIEAWREGQFQGNHEEWCVAIQQQTTKPQTAQINNFGNDGPQFMSEPLFAQAKASPTAEATASSIVPPPSELLIFSPEPTSVHETNQLESRSVEGKASIEHEDIDATRNAWDLAYAYFDDLSPEEQLTTLVEPNVIRQSPVQEVQAQTKSKSGSTKAQEAFLSTWPYPVENNPIPYTWHLDEDFSQLAPARDAIMANPDLLRQPIRIAHLDTGYLDIDLFKPERLLVELGKNFAENNDDARDIEKTISILPEQQGHGAATLAILAGAKVDNPLGMPGYSGYIGGIPFAEIIPIRIQDSVALLKTDAVAKAIDYAMNQGCEVLTMSMGGAPSQLWANVINEAYLRGMTIVTAAGNSWRKGFIKVLPDALVYPARFERVIGAAGIAHNQQPYIFEQNDWEEQFAKTAGGVNMQGNYGPDAQMWHVMAAYTPNVFWTETGQDKGAAHPEPHFIMKGGGTSSAAPQIAAAAALWIVRNRKTLKQKGYHGTWKQVEAVRYALFKSAEKFDAHTGSIADAQQKQGKYYSYLGQGALRALRALEVEVPAEEQLHPSPPAKIPRFPIISTLTGRKGTEDETKGTVADTPAQQKKQEMLSLELLQLILTDPSLHEFARLEIDDEQFLDRLDDTQGKRLQDAIQKSALASQTLKNALHSYFEGK